MLPNRIPPDVVRDSFVGIGTAQDMVVVAHFPKVPAIALVEREGSARFKDTNEFREVRQWMSTLREEVQVVGHETVGVENEGVSLGTIDEKFTNHFGSFGVCQIGLTKIAADGYEVGFGANVVLGGQAGLFSG
jgi:hypothetical protein